MFDIYKLFYFFEETGLLIQEKCYKATHLQIWDSSLRKHHRNEQDSDEEDSEADVPKEIGD